MQGCGVEILAEMLDRGCAGDQQNVGRAMKKPGECDLHGSGLQRRRDCVERRGLQGSESSQREERHIGDALGCEVVDEGVIAALGDVVEILHADDLGDRLRLCQLRGSDVAEAEMANQALMLEFGKHGQRRFDGSFGWRRDSSDAKVDDVERVEPEVAEIVMHTIDEFLA